VFPISRKGLSLLGSKILACLAPQMQIVLSPVAEIVYSTLHATGWKLLPPVAFANNSVPVLSATLDRVVYYATRKVSRDIAVLSFFSFSFATSIHGIKL
jgi:hypothetical protein